MHSLAMASGLARSLAEDAEEAVRRAVALALPELADSAPRTNEEFRSLIKRCGGESGYSSWNCPPVQSLWTLRRFAKVQAVPEVAPGRECGRGDGGSPAGGASFVAVFQGRRCAKEPFQ